jgi:hypothetical protein
MSMFISVLVCLDQVFLQFRGSCIGSQISPPICNVAVAFDEHMWCTSFNILIKSFGLFARYVDNRAIIACKHVLSTPQFTTFLSLDFYRPPIELEALDDNILLGFKICLFSKTCQFIMPTQLWQFRSSKSAGTLTQNLSGLTSRLYTIMRGTFPKSLSKPSCRILCDKYIELGFHRFDVEQIYKKVINKCRAYNDQCTICE